MCEFQQQWVVDLLKLPMSEHYLYHDPNWYVCMEGEHQECGKH